MDMVAKVAKRICSEKWSGRGLSVKAGRRVYFQ